MKKFYSSVALLFAICMATPALATSLADLIGGQSLIVGDKEFYNWSAGERNDTDFRPVDYSQIEVTGDATDPLNIGLIYDTGGQLYNDFAEGYRGDFVFTFDVKTVSGLSLIKGHSLELTSWDIDEEGNIVVFDYLVSEPPYGGTDVFPLPVGASETGGDYYEDMEFFWLLSSFRAGTHIHLWPDEGNVISLYSFEQRFSQVPATVPEPATMLLLGTGLVGVAGAARRKKKNQA